jgi:hypothetical protein
MSRRGRPLSIVSAFGFILISGAARASETAGIFQSHFVSCPKHLSLLSATEGEAIVGTQDPYVLERIILFELVVRYPILFSDAYVELVHRIVDDRISKLTFFIGQSPDELTSFGRTIAGTIWSEIQQKRATFISSPRDQELALDVMRDVEQNPKLFSVALQIIDKTLPLIFENRRQTHEVPLVTTKKFWQPSIKAHAPQATWSLRERALQLLQARKFVDTQQDLSISGVHLMRAVNVEVIQREVVQLGGSAVTQAILFRLGVNLDSFLVEIATRFNAATTMYFKTNLSINELLEDIKTFAGADTRSTDKKFEELPEKVNRRLFASTEYLQMMDTLRLAVLEIQKKYGELSTELQRLIGIYKTEKNSEIYAVLLSKLQALARLSQSAERLFASIQLQVNLRACEIQTLKNVQLLLIARAENRAIRQESLDEVVRGLSQMPD